MTRFFSLSLLLVALVGCDTRDVGMLVKYDERGCAYPYATSVTTGGITGVTSGHYLYRGHAICIYDEQGFVLPQSAYDESESIINENIQRGIITPK